MGNQINVISEEHKKFNTLLSDLAKYDTNCGKFFAELLKIIEHHSELEEQVVIPLLTYIDSRLHTGDGLDKASLETSYGMLLEKYDTLVADHTKMRKVLEEAKAETYKIEVQRIIDDVLHHMKMEEEIAYPAAVAAGEILHFDRSVEKRRLTV